MAIKYASIVSRNFYNPAAYSLWNWLILSAYIAVSNKGNNPMIDKCMIPMAQSKYTNDLKSIARAGLNIIMYKQYHTCDIEFVLPVYMTCAVRVVTQSLEIKTSKCLSPSPSSKD